ncbi:hypothetical protein [Azonexus hydrophilus]|uniref:WGR domain-containing protein n=1 Tax=Azonexus hydrophilus TaxID=418702 RepID=A0ABZ2XMJ4_9RHOO
MKLFKHKQSGKLVEVIAEEWGVVKFSSQGGGFLHRMKREAFETAFVAAVFDGYCAGKVGAEFLPDDLMFDCFSNGQRWNGWGMPYFTLENGLRLAALKASDLVYDAEGDRFVFRVDDSDPESDEVYPATMITTASGETVKAYPIGAGSWCWDAVEGVQ